MTFWRKNPPSLSQRLISVMGGAALAAALIIIAIAHYRERATVLEGQERDYRLFVAALAHAAASALHEDATHPGHLERLLTNVARDPQVRTLDLLRPDGTLRQHAGSTKGAAPDPQLLQRALQTGAESAASDIRARLIHFVVPLPEAQGGRSQALLAQAAGLGTGDLSVRSGLDAARAGSQEIHQLAIAFDSMAARMQESEEQLEERARERTRELEIAVAELESFSYAVAHDLRSPLRSIDGFALILAERLGADLTDELRGYIDRVRQQAQYMGSLIDNLLTLAHVSRAEVGRSQLDLSALAHECVATLRRSDSKRRVDVLIQPQLAARADPDLLRVAMSNLIHNAWKFTRNTPHARIEVGVENLHNRAAAFVRDNGVGFDSAYVERLFTPFRRLHSPREFGGTGIGLAIVQRVIQRHGGQIWAQSHPGQGATFYFTLAGL